MNAFVFLVLILFFTLLTVTDLLPALAEPPARPDRRTQA
jgi:hypothetical protein